ncbi:MULTISPECIES: Orn/Lys/Arg family decarboxylase [Staphylococcus]|uniref:Lysine decarboxylase n=1 Tax=Staphylococcus chromogenes TaxID=46126 RepID=A0AAE5W805_STACR|nr:MULTISPECIES: lysine decarboxylase [Staphylococcus]MBP0047059.1 lysine decarboxylase [Staphylococcus chromogenes]MBV5192249.1 lysine decarboxylase [Staphylococcus chromogenes]MBW3133323.1 lysine decarboxylase [Staphylococcus chromogenes]MCE4971816.1 lysine decarboxylase [Staphylococcus chromogenes]MCE5005886.1 lysine decarboxylase [Staphylococcus chromogenes]
MKGPLYQRLETWATAQPISMHVPGHKNQTIGDLSFLSGHYDITEITGFDDLHHPEDVLKDSMATIQRHSDYDAYFLVNGTTSGILATIHAFQSLPGQVIMARNVHKSVFNALDLGHQQAFILPTEIHEKTYQYLTPRPENIKLDNGKLGVITYPNYYGQTFDVARTIEAFHQGGIPVLVDEAHGAHFGLKGFPSSALNAQADYVVQSFHKTLPSLTMSSVLYIHKKAPRRDQVIHLLQTFQSSSPSYLLMTSLESANAFYVSYESGRFFERRHQVIQALKEKGLHVKTVDDPLKLLIYHSGLSGYELQKRMESLHIYAELADDQHVLWILPLWHANDTFPMEDLLRRLQQMKLPDKQRQNIFALETLYTGEGQYVPDTFEQTRTISFHEAEGATLAQHLTVYPPGVPTLLKGEKLTASMIALINAWYDKGLRVEGLYKDKIKVKDD